MRYRGENFVEKSVNDGYRERYRERRLEIVWIVAGFGAAGVWKGLDDAGFWNGSTQLAFGTDSMLPARQRRTPWLRTAVESSDPATAALREESRVVGLEDLARSRETVRGASRRQRTAWSPLRRPEQGELQIGTDRKIKMNGEEKVYHHSLEDRTADGTCTNLKHRKITGKKIFRRMDRISGLRTTLDLAQKKLGAVRIHIANGQKGKIFAIC
jgi:hypothetical protein